MRPDPNSLAQGILRLLKQVVQPELSSGADATVSRITAILRDTDWNESHTVLEAEMRLLKDAVLELARQDLCASPAFDHSENKGYAALSLQVIALRAEIGKAVAQMASHGGPGLTQTRRTLAGVLADCADCGVGQTSAGTGRPEL